MNHFVVEKNGGEVLDYQYGEWLKALVVIQDHYQDHHHGMVVLRIINHQIRGN